MGEFIRVRCPFCGMLPFPKQLENAEGKPAVVEIVLVTMGGKVKVLAPVGLDKFKKKGKGQAPGGIVYQDVTALHPELVEKWTKWFGERAVKFAQESGLLPGGE